jgi:hypothetical protein
MIEHQLANWILSSINSVIGQIPALPDSPSLIRANIPSSSAQVSIWVMAQSIATIIFTLIAIFVALKYGIKKSAIEPDLMKSTIQSNLANADKLKIEQNKIEKELEKQRLDMDKLQLEIIEKQISLGKSLSVEQSEYLDIYRDNIKMQNEFINKQDDYINELKDYVFKQNSYIESLSRPTIEMIGIVQKLILRAIAIFLIISFYNQVERNFNDLLNIIFIFVNSYHIKQIIKITLETLFNGVYEIIVFSWGIELFKDVNKFVNLNLDNLPISLKYFVKKFQQ